jgi:antitoxin VapB
MQRQLNIRSDEAYGIAHCLAQRKGKAVTEIVVTALKEYFDKEKITGTETFSEQNLRYERIMSLAREVSQHKKSALTSDHSDLYDENGLPR